MFLTRDPLSPGEFLKADFLSSCGGHALFVGTVRDHHEGRAVRRLFYDCYEPMAEKEIGRIVERARQVPGVGQVRVLHRIGRLELGEAAVIIFVSAAHREEAFTVCRRVLDEIKARVPIWKKEEYADGSSGWVLCPHGETAPQEPVNCEH